MTSYTLYDPFKTMEFSDLACFLCGRDTDNKQPVFPAWLTSRYHLKEQQLLLLDKSISSYGGLTIPCCTNCETSHIQPLEQEVENAVAAGPEAIKALDTNTWFKWMGRIFYGQLINELQREKAPLVKPEYPLSENIKMLQRFEAFFKLLQAIRLPMVFDDFTPCSLFILPAGNKEFSFEDELTTMMFSIRLEGVELICCLLDNGIIKKALGRVYNDIAGKELHPIQVAEFKARVYYAAYLLNVIPEYFARPVKPGDSEIIIDSVIDDITASVFNPWENPSYATMLEKLLAKWYISKAEILRNPSQPLSFLYDETGQFRSAGSPLLEKLPVL